MVKTITEFGILLFSFNFILHFSGTVGVKKQNEFKNKIAFLKNAEVWISDIEGKTTRQLTKTENKVQDFIFSPTLKHLAYSKIIKYVDEPGLWEEEEEIPKRAVCSILILKLETQEILKEILPREDTWIYPIKWLPGEKLLFYESSGFDVSAFFEYDVNRDIEKEIDYQTGSQLSNADFNTIDSTMVYVDNIGVGSSYKEQLHMVDLKSKDDKILISKKSILDPKMSYSKEYIAFFEVENVNNYSFDILWIYNTKNATLKKLYKGVAMPKSGGASELSWSFDDQHIGMFFNTSAIVLEECDTNKIHKIIGTDFSWCSSKEIIFVKQSCIYLYNLHSKKESLLFTNSTKPFYLRKEN